MQKDRAACFNLNFSNPGGTTSLQSLILSPSSKANCSPDDMETFDSDSKESTPTQFMSDNGNPTPPTSNRMPLPNGKKTKGRVKIKMEYIGNKLRRYTTFSKRKTGIMKKAHELSTLTGTQVMLIVASETGHVYAFATNKLKPLISGEPGKSLIQNCLNAPDSDNDSTAVKTEFTFDPPSNSCANLSNSNLRKRKLDANEEMMTLPTMVSSSPQINDYCDSDNESEESDSHLDDDQPPLLRQSNVVDPMKLLKEAMRAASEQRQRQSKPPPKPKTQQIKVPNNRQNRQQNDPNQVEQALLAFLAQGLASQSPSSTHKNLSSTCRASPSPSSSSTINQFGTSKRARNNQPKDSNTSPSTSSTDQILFQLPQGTVYAASPDSSSPLPTQASSHSPFNNYSIDSPKLFSAAAINGTSSSGSSVSPANIEEQNQQQLINNLFLNSGGNNMQNFFEILSRLNDSSGK